MFKYPVQRGKIFENKVFKCVLIVLGGLIYSFGVNRIVRPLGVFNGGCVGLAQLIEHFINISFGEIPNIYAILYIILNVPLLILAFRGVGRRFAIRTLIAVGSTTVFGYLIPTAAEPVIENTLTCALLGGMITGLGTGISLYAGGCGGGIDILGIYFTKRKPDASVGKVSIIFNCCLYAIVFFIFDIEAVVYSVVVLVTSSLVLDKVHKQNIAQRCMIFTKMDGLDKRIMEETYRGVTRWEGIGAYTNQTTNVLVSVINKYEEHDFLELVNRLDPHAFVIMDEHVRIRGNFLKKL